eukprot:555547_1
MSASSIVLLLICTVVSKATSMPTPKPTHPLYPCDFIDPVINGSNCGVCVSNSSCSWCPMNNSCHETATYDPTQCQDEQTGQPVDVIHGPNHLFQCCETSITCERCTTLYYVGCDWCITTKTCFNATRDEDCHENGKEIIFKDGVCRDDPHPTIWDTIRNYYLRIPLVYRIVLLTLLSICAILFSIFMCLCVMNCCQKRKLKKKYRRMSTRKAQRNVNAVASNYVAIIDPK